MLVCVFVAFLHRPLVVKKELQVEYLRFNRNNDTFQKKPCSIETFSKLVDEPLRVRSKSRGPMRRISHLCHVLPIETETTTYRETSSRSETASTMNDWYLFLRAFTIGYPLQMNYNVLYCIWRTRLSFQVCPAQLSLTKECRAISSGPSPGYEPTKISIILLQHIYFFALLRPS